MQFKDMIEKKTEMTLGILAMEERRESHPGGVCIMHEKSTRQGDRGDEAADTHYQGVRIHLVRQR